jgi:hypothetical protein
VKWLLPIVLLAVPLWSLNAQGRVFRVSHPIVTEQEQQSDSIERATTLAGLWLVDEGELVRQGDSSHYSKTSADNYINNGGAADTGKLTSLRRDHISFQSILYTGASSVDSLEVYLDSLVRDGGGYTIKNDSGRKYNNIYWFEGRPIEHFVVHYQAVEDEDTTSYDNGMYVPGPPEAQPQPDADYKGMLPNWCIPADIDSGTYSNGQGGYPFKVAANSTQSILTDVFVDSAVLAGVYRGRLRVYEGGYLTHSKPIVLTVHDYVLSDTLPHRVNFYVNQDLPTYYAGHAPNSDEFWAFMDRTALLMKRHGINMSYQTVTAESMSVRQGKYYALPSTFFSKSAGYDGLGEGLGFSWYMIGVYDMPRFVADTGGYSSNCGWPSGHDESGWKSAADKWEDTLRAITNDNNQDYVWRTVFGPDEPLRDRTMYDWIYNRAYWTHNSAGNGQYLDWLLTSWMDPDPGHNRLYPIIDYWCETNRCDTVFGYHDTDDSVWFRGEYYPDRARDRRAAGDKVGWYNLGTRPAYPVWTVLDAPLTEARACAYIDYRDSVDFRFQWHSWWYAESYQKYGGTWKDALDTVKLVDSGEWEDFGIQEAQLVWTLLDTLSDNNNSRGVDGPIVPLRAKNVRRAQLTYQYLHEAERLGVNVSVVIDSACGRTFDTWGPDPNWPESYSYGYAFQPHWREQGHYYETYRRALIDSIIARTE